MRFADILTKFIPYIEYGRASVVRIDTRAILEPRQSSELGPREHASAA